MANGTDNAATGRDRRGKIVARGAILKDPNQDARWYVARTTKAGAWVIDYPVKDGQTEICFTWDVVERLYVVNDAEPNREAA